MELMFYEVKSNFTDIELEEKSNEILTSFDGIRVTKTGLNMILKKHFGMVKNNYRFISRYTSKEKDGKVTFNIVPVKAKTEEFINCIVWYDFNMDNSIKVYNIKFFSEKIPLNVPFNVSLD